MMMMVVTVRHQKGLQCSHLKRRQQLRQLYHGRSYDTVRRSNVVTMMLLLLLLVGLLERTNNRSILLIVAAASSSATIIPSPFHTIAGYQPESIVTDQNAIDLDMKEIEELLSFENQTEKALNIYRYGGNSRSYAELTIVSKDGIPIDVDAHTILYGTPMNMTSFNETHNMRRTLVSATNPFSFFKSSKEPDPIVGWIMNPYKVGTKTIQVLYNVSEDPMDIIQCKVGSKQEPILDGCFAPTGNVTIQGNNRGELYTVPYKYDPLKMNKNDRSIQIFSTKASAKMKPCNACDYYAYYQKFFQYYGKTTYGNEYIMAAAKATRVVFDSSDADFTSLSYKGRTASMLTAMVTMNIAMYVIRELEHAVAQCHNCPPEGCDAFYSDVDAGWALYTGTLEGQHGGSGNGKLMFALADNECKLFKTCGIRKDSTKGMSNVNFRIRTAFQIMQHNISDRACAPARNQKDLISALMYVPMIQGTLRYAYKRSKMQLFNATDEDVGIGATLAASVVPVIAACSYHDASTVMSNMALTAVPDFGAVREAIENHYDCLGLKCADIGGLWDADNHEYYDGFQPCTFDETVEESTKPPYGLIAMMTVFGLGIVYLLYRCFCKKKSRSKRSSDDDDDDDDDDEDADFVV